MRDPSVILVSMPWTGLTEPSVGLGILRAVLDESGIKCRVMHLNLFLLEHFRPTSYYAVANVFSLNDFLFSGVLEKNISPRQLRWLRIKAGELLAAGLIDSRQYGGIDGVVEKLLLLRGEVIPRWLSNWADAIAASDASLVGLSCMFDQTIASLALAKMIKMRAPDKTIALGGYAVRHPTGGALLRSFDWIDAICVGEGEPVIAPLAHASAGICNLADVPGLLLRQASGGVVATKLPGPVQMDTVPPPNFDDFFADRDRLSHDFQVDIRVERLPLENSRGCWWGQVKHCVFCGIHDDDMVYRARSAEKVLDTMGTLAQRYGYYGFRFTDYILPHQYYRTLLPALAAQGSPYRITAEIKANVNSERFALLADGGFDEVQPGIESFSTNVLKQMDKGVSAVQNVHTLLLGKRSGIFVHYNLLYGLPGDLEADYMALVQRLPRLFHLDPPATRLLAQVTRFAPLQVNPERFGIPRAHHEGSYELIFSQEFLDSHEFNLDDYCYYFERPFENSLVLRQLYRELDRLVDRWKELWSSRNIHLTYMVDECGRMHISDSRSGVDVESNLPEDEAVVYLSTLEPTSRSVMAKRLAEQFTPEALDAVLERLLQRGLLFEDGSSLVGLALPATCGT